MEKKSSVSGRHYWQDVMSRLDYLSKDSHDNIHDAMAYNYVIAHFQDLEDGRKAHLVKVISLASRKGGWQSFRLHKRKTKKPLYRGGRGSDITWVSNHPSRKSEHFIRESDRTWTRIGILEEEMSISALRNKDRINVRWLTRKQSKLLMQHEPEVLGPKAVEEAEKDE